MALKQTGAETSMVLERQLVTVEEFEKLLDLPEYSDSIYELIGGNIVKRPHWSSRQVRLAGNFYEAVEKSLKNRAFGRIDAGVMCKSEGDSMNMRCPDLSFFQSMTRPAELEESISSCLPDMAVEIKSDDVWLLHLREKIKYYLSRNTKLGIILYPPKRLVEFYPKGQDVQMLNDTDTLDLSIVLPTLKIQLTELFRGA
jgi:Uma2 family endonuclease